VKLAGLMTLYFAFNFTGFAPMLCWMFSKEANNIALHFSIDYMALQALNKTTT
jgi:hypothetical protein